MARLRFKVIVLTAVALTVTLLSGCVTSAKYYLAPEDTPPAVPLNLVARTPALDLTLNTVIVYQGPGSWKQEALWDEYVIVLANRSAGPVAIDSASLIDPLGEMQVPGINPWVLEKLSEANWKKYTRVGLYVLGGGVAIQSFGLGLYAAGMGGGAAAGWFVAVPLALVANVVIVGVKNRGNKRIVNTEFDRRRLRLPFELTPGEAMQGSFFFPVVPGPQQLILRGKAGEAPLEILLDLKPLAGLHASPATQ